MTVENEDDLAGEPRRRVPWSAIVAHLENLEAVPVPEHFRATVKRRVLRDKWRRDLWLTAQISIITGVVLLGLTASILGTRWWQFTNHLLRTETFSAVAQLLTAVFANTLHLLKMCVVAARPLLPCVPVGMLVAALVAALLEWTILRVVFRRRAPAGAFLFHSTSSPHAS